MSKKDNSQHEIEKAREKIYLACPVRGATREEEALLDLYVANLEKHGRQVHYPKRDVDQNDPIGIRIITEHRQAMSEASSMHIYFNPTSNGSVFDYGMGFFGDKGMHLINPMSSYADKYGEFVLDNSNGLRSSLIDHLQEEKKSILEQDFIEYEWKTKDKDRLFHFGMAFMARKPIILRNREEIAAFVQAHPGKSYEHVLLHLDAKNRGEKNYQRKK